MLNSLLDLERTAVLAYTVGSRHLTGAARALAAKLVAQERAHARVLEQAVRRLGSEPARARPNGQYLSGFPPLPTADAALRFALDIENTQVSAYSDSLGTIVTPELRATIAAILGAEAEHMSVILGELHQPQAPDALVTGNAPT